MPSKKVLSVFGGGARVNKTWGYGEGGKKPFIENLVLVTWSGGTRNEVGIKKG